MPLMSRFRKDNTGDDDPLDDIREAEEQEEEGLFMPTNPGRGDAEQAQGPAAQEGDGEVDELLEAASEESPLAEAVPSSTDGDADSENEGVDVESGGPVVQAVSAEGADFEQSGDDALALFRASAAESDVGDLTKEIEDVPVAELLAELRELRAMLVSNQPSVDDRSE